MCKLRIFAKFASSWPPAGCKFHSVGRQLHANFIQSAASRMKISFSKLPAGCKLHPASGLALQNTQIYQCGMWLATNRMKLVSGWRPAGCKFCINKWLAHCLSC
jgi:hypothetical protein